MTNRLTPLKIKQIAASRIEEKLGLRVTPADLMIIDVQTYIDNDGLEFVKSVEFYRNGFPKVVYTAAFRYHEWKLVITNTDTDREILIS